MTQPEVNDLDPFLGKWSDGSVHPVPEKTWGSIKELLSAHRGLQQETDALRSHTTHDHNQIRIIQRLDKSVTVCIYQQGKQLTGVPVRQFLQPGDEPAKFSPDGRPLEFEDDHLAVLLAVSVLSPIAD